MGEIELKLREAATTVGVEARLETLRSSVDEAIDSYPDDADPRYLSRLIDQRKALNAPELSLIAQVAVQLCESQPRLAAVLAKPLATAAVASPLLRPAMNRLQRMLEEAV